jgi:hypothetical protein
MLIKAWRFATIMLVAISLTAAFAHLMELPAKMEYDASLYVMLHRTLYPNYGRIAGPAEGIALLASLGLAWRVRRRGKAFPLTLAAAVCQVLAMTLFLALIQPVNRTMASWPLDEIPPEWTALRDRWEYSHAVRAFLTLTALGALVLSVIRETPQELPPKALSV